MPPNGHIDNEGVEQFYYIDEVGNVVKATDKFLRTKAIARMLRNNGPMAAEIWGEDANLDELTDDEIENAYWASGHQGVLGDLSWDTYSGQDYLHTIYTTHMLPLQEQNQASAGVFSREGKDDPYLTPEKYWVDNKVSWFDDPDHNRLATLFHKNKPVSAGWYVVSIDEMLQEGPLGEASGTGVELLNAYNVNTRETALFRTTPRPLYDPLEDHDVQFIQTTGMLPFQPPEGQSFLEIEGGTDPTNGRRFISKILVRDSDGTVLDAGIEYIRDANDEFIIDPTWVDPETIEAQPQWTPDGEWLFKWQDGGMLHYDPSNPDAEDGWVTGLPPDAALPDQIANMLASGIDESTGREWYSYWDTKTNTIKYEFGSPQDFLKADAGGDPQITYANGMAVRQQNGTPQVWENGEWRNGVPPNTVSEVMADGTVGIFDLNTGQLISNLGTPYSTFTDQRDFAEDQRQFNVEETRRNRQFAVEQDLADRELAARNYFNTVNDLSANYRTLLQTSPQLANAATQQGQLVADILASGGDVLARTFFTRGGISPLPEITQADLLENLSREFQNIATFETEAIEAGNQRRADAEERRAREEWEAYKTQFDLDRVAQYGKYRNEMQPTTKEETVRTGTNQAYEDAMQANLQGYQDYAANILAEGDQGAAIIAAGLVADAGGDPDDPAQVADMLSTITQAATGASDLASTHIAASQLGWKADYIDPNDPKYSTFGTKTITTQPDPMSPEAWRAANPAQPMSYEAWLTGGGPSFTFSAPMSVPEFPTFSPPTQQEIIGWADATQPPAVQAMFQGTMPTPLSFGDIPVPTLQQLNTLTPAEREMYNTSLLARGNVDLDTVRQAARTQFGPPSMDRSRDLARFRGYSV